MKRTIQLMIGGCLVAIASAANAADWEVRTVTKQASPAPSETATAENAGKFLHVTLDVTGNAPNWNKFKVVNEQGEEIAQPAGYNPKQSLVVFEGDWSNMIGRYLENGEVKIPLFQKEAPVDAAPEAVAVQETPVQPVVVQNPDVVVEHPVVEHTAIVKHDPVVIHDGVVERDVRVIDDRDRVVVHDNDGVVVHHGDAVVHHGGAVVHDGVGVVHHGGVGVVHHGDGTVHHIHHGDGVDHVGAGVGGVGGVGGAAGGGAVDAVAGPWDIDPLGRTLGMAGTVAMGDTAGVGGFGSGYGVGYGYGPGVGVGPGSGDGMGSGDGSGPGDGSGSGDGCGNGPGDGSGDACGCDEAEGEGPEEGPDEKEPNFKPGEGPGAGGNGSMSNFTNLAPQYRQRVRNLAPKMKLPKVPVIYGPDLLVYNPQIPYWNPQLPYFNPGQGYGYGGGGGYGYGGGGGGDVPANLGDATFAPIDTAPGMVLYISCGDENSPGKVYQVDEQGRVLGVVNLPQTATGIALHREHGLVCVSPRQGGKVHRISDGGIVEPILEQDAKMAHPVDVAMGPNSDTMVLVDDMTDTITLSNTQGKSLDVYKKIEGIEGMDNKDMSVALGRDKAILFGNKASKGIYRFSGNAALTSSTPVLPEAGGVAADPISDRWAATQGNNQIVLMEGENEVTRYELPAGKFFYEQGLLSFAPPAGKAETAPNSGVVVAMRDSDNTDNVHLMEFKTNSEGKVDRRLLFEWDKEPIVDFVVGPRMLWEQNNRESYKSLY